LRYAVYFAPAESSALWQAGCGWLGRDARTGARLAQPTVDGWSAAEIERLTASPRMYGFHATLKPPFHLAEGYTVQQLTQAMQRLAAASPAFVLPQLELGSLDGFLALQAQRADARLSTLADACVTELDHFRAAPSADELAQRRAAGLSARHEQLLARFGYPYVLDQFRFHMTLTERLPPAQSKRLRPWLADHLADALALPVRCDDLCLFVQQRRDDAFVLRQRFALDIR
jgi:putative phosphonate metabolism protein